MGDVTILVSANLSGEGQKRKLEYFEGLDRALRAKRAHLVLLNLVPKRPETQCECICVPNFIHYFSSLRHVGLVPRVTLDDGLLEAIRRESDEYIRDETAASSFKARVEYAFFSRRNRGCSWPWDCCRDSSKTSSALCAGDSR